MFLFMINNTYLVIHNVNVFRYTRAYQAVGRLLVRAELVCFYFRRHYT